MNSSKNMSRKEVAVTGMGKPGQGSLSSQSDTAQAVLEAYEDLAIAIIELAADDYRCAKAKLKRKPANESAFQEVENIRQFFKSEWFHVLTNVDPVMILERLDGRQDDDG